MMTRLKSAALCGIEAIPVEVEVDLRGGLPGFHLVGLPTGAVREGDVRIKSAIKNCKFELGSPCVIVNLAPADVRDSPRAA
jgi:magnesium chelatase family protein